MSYISQQGNYYEGDKQYGDIDVPKRPSPNHIWQDGWVLVPPTPQEQMATIQAKVEEHFNTVAQARSFDSRVSCMAYAGFVNPFQADSLAFGQWVAACWVLIYQAQADIAAGLRTIPTPEEAVLELPLMVWTV